MSGQNDDIPVIGLENGRFYPYHVTAIACISASLLCVGAILYVSVRSRLYKPFYRWGISERFVVYIALCDGLFNVTHVLDHVHMVITKSHVHPKSLCVVYAFLIVVFTTAQGLLVLVIALNSFSVVILGKSMNFGAYDWRLAAFVFGIPVIESSLACSLNQLGPNGSFCGIRGRIALMVIATVPETSILVVTCSLYVIIWCRIRRDIRQLQLSKQARSRQHSHNAARIMTLFVTAYVVQWSSISASGILSFLGEVPEVMDYLVITSTNMGGVFNGIAFLVIQVMRRRQRNRVVPPNTEQRRRQTAVTKY